MATLHVRLDFTVSKSPLVPFNSTICSRNDPKRHQKAPKSAQFWAKNSHFSPKTALVRVQNSQTKANGCYIARAA